MVCKRKNKRIIASKKGMKCKNTYSVEGLRHKLLSVAYFNNIGYKDEFMNEKSKLLVKIEEISLWNKRMCHVIFDTLVMIRVCARSWSTKLWP